MIMQERRVSEKSNAQIFILVHSNHTRSTSAQQDTSYKPGNPLRIHTKLEKDQTSVVAQPCLPQPPSPSFKTQAKCSKN